MKTFAALSLGLAVLSCNQPQRSVRYSRVDEGKITSFSTPADLRLAFMRPGKNGAPAIYCAEPVPDVALGSELSGSGSLGATSALTGKSLLTSSLTRENAALEEQNASLRRELEEAVREYERETRREYKTTYRTERSADRSSTSDETVNLTAAAKLAVTVSELGGRSQQVLLAREFLYRLCEAKANDFIKTEGAYILMQATALSMIQSIYEAQHSSTAAQETAAYAEAVKQVNTFNDQHKKTCEAQRKVCDEGVPKDKDGKADAGEVKKCIQWNKECLAIEVKAPEYNAPKKEGGKSLVEQVMDTVEARKLSK